MEVRDLVWKHKKIFWFQFMNIKKKKKRSSHFWSTSKVPGNIFYTYMLVMIQPPKAFSYELSSHIHKSPVDFDPNEKKTK